MPMNSMRMPMARFGGKTPAKRCLPLALYHITTERNWKQIQKDGVLKKGKGLGWSERQGVFAVDLLNYVFGKWLKDYSGYLWFLAQKLTRKTDKMVLLRIPMTPELQAKTQVALISHGSDNPTVKSMLAKALAGRFSTIKNPADIVLLESGGLRNTVPLAEFVREVPPSAEPLEYIIDAEIPASQVRKVAELAKADIPASILQKARETRTLFRMMEKTGTAPPEKKGAKNTIVPYEDKREMLARLLASHKRFKVKP
jgi:hypothetical protein